MNPRTIKPITDLQGAKGVLDFYLILMEGWNEDWRRGDIYNYLAPRATEIFQEGIDIPIVREGRIVGWIRKVSKTTTLSSQD